MAPSTEEMVLHGLQLAGAALYVWVGTMLLRRGAPEPARPAMRGFVLWWYGLAFVGLMGVVFALGFNIADHGLLFVRLFVYLFLGFIYVMLGGLVYYLVYLYSGKNQWLVPVVAYYALQLVLLAYLFESQGPYIGMGEGGANEVMYRDRLPPGNPLSLVFSLGLLIPPLIAAMAYALLYFQVDDRTSRYRVALVSGGIILWFGYSSLSAVTRSVIGVEEQSFLGRLVGQLLGVLAGTLVILAYAPPRTWRQRFGLRSVLQEQRPPKVGGTVP